MDEKQNEDDKDDEDHEEKDEGHDEKEDVPSLADKTFTIKDGDMAKLAEEPRNIEWLQICDPMQVPLEGETGWREMERGYFNP